jgi:hypothetical protein
MKAAALYDPDFADWAVQNAALLRAGLVAEAALEHIAEEIEDMAGRDRRAVRNRLARLIEYLLNWQFQPVRRRTRWRKTIIKQRFQIRQLLDENLSFRRELAGWMSEVYEHSVRLASLDTGLERGSFPETCPYTANRRSIRNSFRSRL